jgi:hypothetical protein
MEILPHERFASGETDTGYSETGEYRHEAGDFFVREKVFLRHPEHPLLGHAVRAPEVTPVGDGNPKVIHPPAKPVLKDRQSTFLFGIRIHPEPPPGKRKMIISTYS